MSKQIVSRKWMGCALVLGLAACGSSSKPGAAPAGSSGAVANVGTSGDTAMPAADRNLVVRHGPMTYVMDTPRNQLEKAGVALEESGLVAALLRGQGLAGAQLVGACLDQLGAQVVLHRRGIRPAKACPAKELSLIHISEPTRPY